MRPSVQIALRVNFLQLLQFHLYSSVQILFQPLPSSVTTFVLIEFYKSKWDELTRALFTTEGFIGVGTPKILYYSKLV